MFFKKLRAMIMEEKKPSTRQERHMMDLERLIRMFMIARKEMDYQSLFSKRKKAARLIAVLKLSKKSRLGKWPEKRPLNMPYDWRKSIGLSV